MSSILRIQHHKIHKSLQKSCSEREYKKNKRGSKRKGKKGKKTHTICVMSRNAGDSLAPSNSTAPPIVSSQSIIQTDCSPEPPPPKKNSKTKNRMRSSFFHSTLFFFGALLHQKQASALAHALREEHVESFGRHRQAKLFFNGKKTVIF